MPISVFLDRLGETELATEAFERGYKNFWERGNDPRMFTALISRLMVYAPGNDSLGPPESKQRSRVRPVPAAGARRAANAHGCRLTD